LNLHLDEDTQVNVSERLKGDFKEFAGRRVADINRKDGLKLVFDNGDWILMRLSGTEPLVRVYTEAGSLANSQKLAEEARAWIVQ
jgi:phosphomannomutase